MTQHLAETSTSASDTLTHDRIDAILGEAAASRKDLRVALSNKAAVERNREITRAYHDLGIRYESALPGNLEVVSWPTVGAWSSRLVGRNLTNEHLQSLLEDGDHPPGDTQPDSFRSRNPEAYFAVVDMPDALRASLGVPRSVDPAHRDERFFVFRRRVLTRFASAFADELVELQHVGLAYGNLRIFEDIGPVFLDVVECLENNPSEINAASIHEQVETIATAHRLGTHWGRDGYALRRAVYHFLAAARVDRADADHPHRIGLTRCHVLLGNLYAAVHEQRFAQNAIDVAFLGPQALLRVLALGPITQTVVKAGLFVTRGKPLRFLDDRLWRNQGALTSALVGLEVPADKQDMRWLDRSPRGSVEGTRVASYPIAEFCEKYTVESNTSLTINDLVDKIKRLDDYWDPPSAVPKQRNWTSLSDRVTEIFDLFAQLALEEDNSLKRQCPVPDDPTPWQRSGLNKSIWLLFRIGIEAVAGAVLALSLYGAAIVAGLTPWLDVAVTPSRALAAALVGVGSALVIAAAVSGFRRIAEARSP